MPTASRCSQFGCTTSGWNFSEAAGNQQQGNPRWIPNPNYTPADPSLPHAQYFQNTIAVPKLTPNTQLLRAIQDPTNQHQQSTMICGTTTKQQN